jgi:hypothetical protein
MTMLKTTFFVLLSAGVAVGADSGSIGGKILTAAGAGVPVPTASVTAKNLATQATQTVRTAADGSYELGGLPPGTYEISVENARGFLPFHQSGVQVAAGKTTRLDIRLDDVLLNTLGDGGVEFAQRLGDNPAASGSTPRTRDGKPDFSGVWHESNHMPVGNGPEPLPWADAIVKQRDRSQKDSAPQTRCLPAGIGLQGVFHEYRIVQTPTLLLIVDGGFNPTRQIYLDGRKHPKDFNPSWMGHSVGHWEGDTLVVDTVGFNEIGWLEMGNLNFPQTEKLRVTERFRRRDLGHLEVENTYDDPTVFKRPFKTRYATSLAPADWEVEEYVCAENNRDVPHLGAK